MRSDFDHVASSYAAPQKIRTSERAIRQLYRPDAIGRKGPRVCLNPECGDPAESIQLSHSPLTLRCGGSSPKISLSKWRQSPV
jgi:hypothetical protein